jgi:hypothetical protein
MPKTPFRCRHCGTVLGETTERRLVLARMPGQPIVAIVSKAALVCQCQKTSIWRPMETTTTTVEPEGTPAPMCAPLP